MADSWTFAVARDDRARTTLVDSPMPAVADGEALLRVDRVGLTANNVTYAVLGEAMRYWEFFPPEPRGLDRQWGLPPLWGFAEVIASTVAGVEAGQRVYGYLPPAGHLVVRPDRVDASGFRDASGHRADLPSPYNAYRSTSGDPAHRAEQEDLLILFRPLFFTSFMLADQIIDNDHYGAQSLVLSSASSKTAYAAACELHGRGPRLIGLTSPGNLAFTRSLGCYDTVLTYDDISALDPVPTVYLDLAGAPATRRALRDHLGDRLVRDIAVGLTQQTPNADAAGQVFFAPVQMRKRSRDWGRDGLDERFTAAWQRFVPVLNKWLAVQVGNGPEALRHAWLDVLAGRTPPRVGHVVQL
ncbi:DUF2855 family protein [Micromonospora maris]|uniref:DUF2855 family protein n=1 Tax=Micromonospora maris TaxID=1003110 RepID=A0A9X0LCA3_9ACTN|nr:DUF2855 family protein [Micromonospora maris]AEB45452.1 hypothetical protein VAB18032_21760 [Micromonospora maris AB-18-032]KUJ44830.1 hypothetical protein ADL17_16950 [Micromonospora maris]